MKIDVSPWNGAMRRRLEQAQRRRAHGDDPPAGLPGRVDRPRGIVVEPTPFGVHPVVLDELRLDRQKRPGADMEGQMDAPDTPIVDRLEKLVGKVEPGRGRGHSARVGGIDGARARR